MKSTKIKILATVLIAIFSFVACQNSNGPVPKEGPLDDYIFSQYKVLERYFNNDNHDSLQIALKPMLELCAKHEQWRYYYMSWELLAEDYVWNHKYEKAIEEAMQMEQDAQRRDNSYGQMEAYAVMGMTYNALSNYEEGARCIEHAISLYDWDWDDAATLVALYYQCAQCYRELDSCQAKCEALFAQWKVLLDRYPLEKADSFEGEWEWHSQYYCSMAEYLITQNRYKEAAVLLDSADYCNTHIDLYAFEEIGILTDRSMIHCGLKEYDEAIVLANKAQHLIDSMLQVNDEFNLPSQINLYSTCTDIQKGLGNYREALEIHERHDSLKTFFSDKEIRQQLNELNKRFEIDEIRKQNRVLQQRSRFTTGGVAMLLGIVAMLVFLVANNRWRHRLEVKNRQLERERNLVVARNKQLAIERDRAESALNAKGAFLQSITHEIRTPLNAIGGFSQVLTMPGIELPEADREDYSLRIQENIRLLTNILDDLILISNMESSTELPEPEDTLPSALVTLAAETVRAQVPSGVTLNTRCDMPEEQVIKTQPQIIQLVLSRLLNNAAKFTKEGSITLSLCQEGGLLHFTVTDTGPGIPADKREFIFERFAKLDSFVQGAGLGLSIARMAAERLGGTLTLDTDYQGGAKFDMLIPISPEE